MRKHAKFFYVLFFIVILSFVFWGVGTDKQSTTVSIAEIGKEKIPAEAYWRAYEQVRASYRDKYKDQFNEELEKKLNLKEKVLNGMIEEKVLLITAKEIGISVSDAELQEAIVNDPRFMRDGVFRKEIYFKTLELNRLTTDMFENSIKQQMTLAKMQRLIWSVVDVSPLDIKDVPEKDAAVKKQLIMLEKSNAAMSSYVDAMRQRLNVKINTDIIS
jgi:peptidyl-prolyl cis-trans isomerase D